MFESTLIKILNTKECSSTNIFLSLIDLYTTHSISLLTYENLSALLKFYQRSFNDLQNLQEISDLMTILFEKDESLYVQVALNYIQALSSVFTESLLAMIDKILKDKKILNDKSCELLCNFDEMPDVLDSKKASKLFDVCHKSSLEVSSDLMAKLLTFYPELAPKKMNGLIKSLQDGLDGTKEIEVLIKIYKQMSDLESYKETLLPSVINYCENGTESQIEKANILLELVQSY